MQPMNEVTFKETQLPPLEKGKKANPGLFDRILTILIIVLLVLLPIATGYFGQLIYNNYSYSHFFVNGMSMYPTINFNAYRTDSSGNKEALSYRTGSFDGSNYIYRCETGLSDSSAGFLERIERFSVVCTFYASDYDSSGALLEGEAAKIKRVIGLPGEALYFDADATLMVSDDGGETFEAVDQPFFEEQSWWTDDAIACINAGKNLYASSNNSQRFPYGFWKENAITLAEDEYFVCGDNRANSRDSRAEGAVKSSYIEGIVVLINGETDYYPSTGTTNADIFDLYFPWNYRYI